MLCSAPISVERFANERNDCNDTGLSDAIIAPHKLDQYQRHRFRPVPFASFSCLSSAYGVVEQSPCRRKAQFNPSYFAVIISLLYRRFVSVFGPPNSVFQIAWVCLHHSILSYQYTISYSLEFHAGSLTLRKGHADFQFHLIPVGGLLSLHRTSRHFIIVLRIHDGP